jgi:hypothetical protein
MSNHYQIHHDIRNAVIPKNYNKNKIVLLYKDTHWLYCYWDITPEERARVRGYIRVSNLHDFTWALKVKSIGNSIHQGENSFFIPVGINADSWYIHVNQPAMIYMVEYGMLSQDYFFIPILHSNTAYTPPDRESTLWNPYFVNIFDLKNIRLRPEEKSVANQNSSSESYFGYNSHNYF